jgi:hypothetical protein
MPLFIIEGILTSRQIGLTTVNSCVIKFLMLKEAFWNRGRRKYLARLLANLVILAIGALGTTEIFKLGLRIKLIIVAAAITLIVGGTIIQPPDDKEGE